MSNEIPGGAFARPSGYETTEIRHGFHQIKRPNGRRIASAIYSLGDAVDLVDELNELLVTLESLCEVCEWGKNMPEEIAAAASEAREFIRGKSHNAKVSDGVEANR